MAVRASKFVSAVAAALFVGMPLAMAQPATTAAQPATTAPDCLTAPRQDTPHGQHWYYHVERGTKRRCWHLGDEGGKAAQAAPSADSSSTADASAGQGEPAAQTAGQAEPAAQSLEDARAEFREPQPAHATPQNNGDNAPAQAAPAGTPTATPAASGASPDQQQAVSGANSPVDSRWPAPNPTISTAAPPPQPAPAPPPQAAAPTNPGPSSQAAPPTVTPAPPADESTPKESARPSASLQMLLLVVLGALALAGLTASVVFRLGRSRKIRIDAYQRRGAIWEGVDRAQQQPQEQLWAEDKAPQPPWIEPVVEKTALRPRAARNAAQAAVPRERYQKIEELLAQLVKQAQQSDA